MWTYILLLSGSITLIFSSWYNYIHETQDNKTHAKKILYLTVFGSIVALIGAMYTNYEAEKSQMKADNALSELDSLQKKEILLGYKNNQLASQNKTLSHLNSDSIGVANQRLILQLEKTSALLTRTDSITKSEILVKIGLNKQLFQTNLLLKASDSTITNSNRTIYGLKQQKNALREMGLDLVMVFQMGENEKKIQNKIDQLKSAPGQQITRILLSKKKIYRIAYRGKDTLSRDTSQENSTQSTTFKSGLRILNDTLQGRINGEKVYVNDLDLLKDFEDQLIPKIPRLIVNVGNEYQIFKLGMRRELEENLMILWGEPNYLDSKSFIESIEFDFAKKEIRQHVRLTMKRHLSSNEIYSIDDLYDKYITVYTEQNNIKYENVFLLYGDSISNYLPLEDPSHTQFFDEQGVSGMVIHLLKTK